MRCPSCAAESPAAARFCSDCGAAVATAAAGETRPLSILFADLSGSVATTYELDPEETAAALDVVLAAMADAVLEQDGHINSYLGDGLLAFFGTPRAHEDDAERAIAAACEIRRTLRERGLDATAGIASGEVYVGGVGSDRHREFAARGRVINLAARLQSKAAPGQILVAESTHVLARRAFAFRPLPLDIKGAGPVTAYEVRGPLARAEKARGIEGLRAALTGRNDELERLLTALDSGSGAVAIVGEAGVGKSRLVLELRARAGDVRWLEGRCLESKVATSYWPFVDVLHQLFGRTDDVQLVEQCARLGLAPETVSLLARVLGLDPGEIERLAPAQLRHRTYVALNELFDALGGERPTVLVLEDLHWADELSLGLVPRLVGSQLRLICVYRPELADAGLGAGSVDIRLEALSPAQTEALVRSLLGFEDAPTGLLEIVARAEGNPFFVEEIVRTLLESGALVRADATWRLDPMPEGVGVPDSVQGVILSRVDRLAPEARGVLQIAAVVGRLFGRALLGTLVGDDVDLDAVLTDLGNRDLVYRERDQPEVEYSFNHVLTQETIYRSILRRRRVELHERVARAIEANVSAERSVERLAYHYDRSSDSAKALEYLARAGDRARAAFLNADAVVYYERALAHDPEDASIHERIGDVLELVGRHEEARAEFAAALAIAPAARLHRKAGKTFEVRRRYSEALAEYDRAEALLAPPEPGESGEEWVQLELERFWSHYFRGDQQALEVVLARVEPLVERFASPLQKARYHDHVVLAEIRRTNFWHPSDESLEHARRAVEVLVGAGAGERGVAEFHLGFCHLWREELESAEQHLSHALELLERVGDVTFGSRALTYLTHIARLRGDLPRLLELLPRLEQVAATGGMAEYQAVCDAQRAWVAWMNRDLAGTRMFGDRAVAVWSSLPISSPFRWLAVVPLLAADLAEGRIAEACRRAPLVLDPAQQPLPAGIAEPLRAALASEEGSAAHIAAAIAAAETAGYL